MLTLALIKQKLSELKPKLQEKYPVGKIAVFGSYARNEATEESDVDVMVEITGKMGLNFITMAQEIEDYLGIKTDVVSSRAIRPRIMEYIKKDLLYV